MKAVVAGVTGAVGSAIARELASSGDWTIAGLSRNPPKDPIAGVEHVSTDLADAERCRRALADHGDATHLFYCGRATHREQTLEDAATNLALLDNVLSAAECGALRHAHLVQGGKVYGVHVGPFPTPAREDDPRAVIENFNYDQEDLLRRRSKGRSVELVGIAAEHAAALLSGHRAQPRLVARSVRGDQPGARLRARLSGTGGRVPQSDPGDLDRASGARDGLDGDRARVREPGVQRDQRGRLPLEPHLAAYRGRVRHAVRKHPSAAPRGGDAGQGGGMGTCPRAIRACATAAVGGRELGLSRRHPGADVGRDSQHHQGARRFGFHDWEDSEERLLALIGEYRAAKILP